MMKVIVDIGNTQAKVGVFDGKELRDVRVYAAWRPEDWQALRRAYPIEGGLLCTVSGCPDWVREVWEAPAFQMWDRYRDDWRYPLYCRSYDIKTVGRDRIAIGVALRRLFPQQTALGIGMGSCITYNLMRPDGRLEPGAISPGVYMRGRAMHAFTEALPRIALDWTAAHWLTPVPVADTDSALRAGVIEGVRYELEGFIRRYREAYGTIPVVLTGGDAGYFEFSTKKRIFANPNLGLLGLNEILDFNK